MHPDLDLLTTKLAGLPVPGQLGVLTSMYPERVALSSSLGPEDQALTHMAATARLPVRVFTLDTGRLFPETYELIDRTRHRYGTELRVYYPDREDVEEFVTTKGVNSFYESVTNRMECCHTRKVRPLRRALQGMAVWITGLRAEQSENRGQMQLLEWNEEYGLIKFNPLIGWSSSRLWTFLHENRVPVNPLHYRGYPSIGCQPCTRAVLPGQAERSGRWWWETEQKECGLHIQRKNEHITT
jgi:phosphoadenosine phosphosulfate reductase